MEQQAEQPQGAVEVGGRVAVNRDEKLVAAWLDSQGYAVRHLTNGEDPPDMVVDGNIAVEVTTIASYAFHSVWDFMDRVCRSLGPAENGRGYRIGLAFDDEELLQNRTHRSTIKRDLRRCAKAALSRHYANPDGNFRIKLPHGVEIEIMGRINNNRDDVKYKVGMGGATGGMAVVPYLIDTNQAAIDKKTANRIIQERADSYAEWWLAITDPHHILRLNGQEIEAVANGIKYRTPWSRILLVSTTGDRIKAVHCLTGNRQ